MSEEADAEDEVYDSGPFCRHWGDPSSCDELCARCGHKCCHHYDECDDCACQEWVEAE